FNPVRWQRTVDGRNIKNPVGADIERLQITRIEPLYLRISLGSISGSESSTRYAIVIEQQAARRNRGPRSYYVSVDEKREYGEDKDSFIVREVKGTPSDPTELVIELSDLEKPISIARDRPYERIDGYMADLRYPPQNTLIRNRRVGDRVVIANEEYSIVSITENEVGLSAKSNQKRWTIKYDRPS
ncbi:MAG TPA: hypothetical protein PLH97_15335, partial [Verrucomicrobiota bacterium]|nr:hypothetical protein [Verrucomicrobiota bacterium]